MPTISIKEAVDSVFQIIGVGYKEMSVEDIALEISYKIDDYAGVDISVIKDKVSAYLSKHTSKIVRGKTRVVKGKLYERVPNGKGTYKKGVYRLIKQASMRPKKPIIEPTTNVHTSNKLYIGTAGEMAVCSELLFRNYNISLMSVDDGVDVVAIKNDVTYYIQVKTVHVTSQNFSVSIKSSSFERYSTGRCFYIVVARGKQTTFLVFTASDISRMIDSGNVTFGANVITLSFSQSDGKIYIKNEDVKYSLDGFSRIV